MHGDTGEQLWESALLMLLADLLDVFTFSFLLFTGARRSWRQNATSIFEFALLFTLYSPCFLKVFNKVVNNEH